MLRDMVADSRSFRSFDESKKIGREILLDLLETARLCPSAVNLQPLKYRLVYKSEETEGLLALTKWGGLLNNIKLPPDGHHPTAFIVVCCDTAICADINNSRFDAGVASQTIMLQACEFGLGGCIIGAFNPDEVSRTLLIPKKYKPIVALALGVPDETVFICDIPKSGDTAYYRDKVGIHFVPKRSTDELIIK